MEQFYAILWTAIGILVTGLASWLTVVITNFFNSKIKDKTIARRASQLTTIILNAVKFTTQTFVDDLKKNGKFTSEAHLEALERTKSAVKNQLTEELKEYISETYGDIESYLTSAIEAQIYTLKK